jgi:hypothetical protein
MGLAPAPALAAGPQENPLSQCQVHDGGDGLVPSIDRMLAGAWQLSNLGVNIGANQRSFSSNTYTIPDTTDLLTKLEGKVNAFCASPTQFSSWNLASYFSDVGKYVPIQDEYMKFIRDHGTAIAQGITDLGGKTGPGCQAQVQEFLAKYQPLHDANKQKAQQLADKLKACQTGKK